MWTPVPSRSRWSPRWSAVVDRFTGQRVVVVAHGGVLNVYLADLLGIGTALWFHPAYTSVSRVLAARGGTRSVASLNETAHLYARRDPQGEVNMSVHVDADGPVRVITIDRPEVRNAVDRPTAEALAAAFRSFEADPDASVAVLTGAGGTFCAGADLQAMSGPNANRVASDGDGPMGPSRMLTDKPVLAAVEGHAVAGRLELACWCDLRIAARDAVFGVFCRRWGVPLIDGGTVRLPRLIGLSHALDLILTGRGVSGDEAAQLGLVNRLTEPGRALDRGPRPGRRDLAALPQRCLRSDRRSTYEQSGHPVGEALALEYRHGLDVLRGEDCAPASRASSAALDVTVALDPA